jgi:hypothetical protein
MSNEFDELARGLAQSVTRRQALSRFGIGLMGMAMAYFGLPQKASGKTTCLPNGYACSKAPDCCSGHCVHFRLPGGTAHVCQPSE